MKHERPSKIIMAKNIIASKKMKNLFMTIDEELHSELKIRATKEGVNMKRYLIQMLKKHFEQDKLKN